LRSLYCALILACSASAFATLAFANTTFGLQGPFIPATGSASFLPSTVVEGGFDTTTYTLTVSNPNAGDLTNVQFSDAYPPGLVADQTGSSTCGTNAPGGNPGGTNGGISTFLLTGFSFTLNTLSGGDSCTVIVLMHASLVGDIVDSTSSFTSNEASPGTSTSAELVSVPTPEPATGALIATGLAGLASLRRRTKRAA
jgi:uncharacterized repeat protein (TIGR01451 family)